jgi:ABC-type nitrate/sulfonate/bicarbonate transport system substrate-binding protein
MNQAYRHKVAVLSLVTSMFVAACGGTSPTTTGTPKAGNAPDKITIGVFDTSLEFSGVLAAGAPGGPLEQVAKQFHTTFDYAYISSGSNLIAALAGGSIQFAAVPGTQVILTGDQGLTLTPLINGFVGPSVMMVAQNKYKASRGTAIEKFDGLRWAYSREGSTSQLAAKVLSEQSGLSWAKQQHIAYGTGTDSQTLLATDRADVLVAGGLPIAKAIDQGIGYLVNNMQADPKFPYGNNLFWVLSALPSFLAQYPELVQAVTTATLKSMRSLQSASGPDAAFKLLPPNAQKDNRNNWETLWKLESSGFSRANGAFSQTGINETLTLLQASVTLKHASDDVKVFNNKYVIKAYNELGLKPPQV